MLIDDILQNPLGTEFTGTYWLTQLVDYNKTVVLSSEHQDYRWVRFKEARKLSSYSNISKLIKNYQDILDCFWTWTKFTLVYILPKEQGGTF